MGRKPNALIVEFFERGPKLADQSNRYQHTCKRCGEIFPKGRPDSLQRHVFEKCPNVTDTDRARALWQQVLPESHTSTDANLPFLPHREPSGLDALAEVSRQMQENGEVAHEESLAAQLRMHMDGTDSASNPPTHADAHLTPSATRSVTPQADNVPLVNAASAANDLAEAEQALLHTTTTTSNPRKRKATPTPPSSAAHYHVMQTASAVDPQLQQSDDFDRFVNSLESGPIRDAPPVRPVTLLQPYAQPSVQPSPQSPAQPFSGNQGGFGLLQRANKNKARGRFTEERRKEVQNVRKKGACIRCRMLKKPCSEGTPCGTCKTIESARLWKNACIRTRIADEFTLYSSSLFYARDHAKVHAATNGIEPHAVQGRIEASLFPGTHIYATFSALRTNKSADSATDIDPDLVVPRSFGATDTGDVFLLSYKTDDTLAAKIERYLHATVMQCISHEPSTFMRSTLEMATELSVEANDNLLSKLINLWAATNLLISDKPVWTISYDPQHTPTMEAVDIEIPKVAPKDDQSSDGERSTRITFATNSPDYDLIHAQLQDAAERYCQKQAKWAMNELERRLLQRQQSSSFLTFLSAVILLNCVERMTGLFHSLDQSQDVTANTPETTQQQDSSRQIPTQPNADDPLHAEPTQHQAPILSTDWPLDSPPSRWWPSGHSFSNLLHLLLRMRGLPPTTGISADGSLVILNTFNKTNPGEVTSSTQGGDSQLLLAAGWIERTGITALELLHARDGFVSESHADGDTAETPALVDRPDDETRKDDCDPRSWDLRFIAPLLLPP